jgi:hypothetical protein
MAKLEGFAFRAAIELFKRTTKYHIIDEVYKNVKAQENNKFCNSKLCERNLCTFYRY